MEIIFNIIIMLLLYGIYTLACVRWVRKENDINMICIKLMVILVTIPFEIIGLDIISTILTNLLF